MEIKEQVKEKEVTEKLALFIRDDINKFGLTKDISDIPAFANTILNNFIIPFLSEWLKDNNYLQIQAGEDGLAKNPYIELIGGFNEIKPTMFDKLSPVDQIRMMGQKEGYEQGRKAQKSLDESQAKQKQADIVVACDMLITELISYKDGKLTFKDIEPSLQRWNQYRIKAFKKQTLEELEEKE